jgi:hypothetical protein
MTDTSELEALKARVKELEASPVPVSGWGGLFSLVGSVVGLVPRWLVVAAGVVFVAWLGLDLYMKIGITTAEKEMKDAQARLAVSNIDAEVEAHLTPEQKTARAHAACLKKEGARLVAAMGADFTHAAVEKSCAHAAPEK